MPDQALDASAGQAATAFEDQRLPMAADIRNQFHPVAGSQQRPALVFLRQGMVVTDSRHAQAVPDIARCAGEYLPLLTPEQLLVEIAGNTQRIERLAQRTA